MKRQTKILFTEPWIGELGWQLFCWQGFIRKLAQKYDRTIVACRTGEDLLYDDFADDIVHYNPEFEETDMCNNRKEPKSRVRNFCEDRTRDMRHVKILPNDAYPGRWWLNEEWRKRQLFVSFGRHHDIAQGFDVLMIVRKTAKCNTAFRDWPREHAQEFTNHMCYLGLSVACVGKSDSATCTVGAVDLRDLSLDKLSQVMARSRVIVGPQSGPIHFGSLCLLPQVSWQTCPEHATRTVTHWNPFGVPSEVMPTKDDFYWRHRRMWLPPVSDIVEKTLSLVDKGVRH